MNTTEFKNGLKALQNQLKGVTLQVITSSSATPYTTLNAFGNAILSEELKGKSFSISQAWTSEGVVIVTSLTQLAQLFLSKKITGIQFKSYFSQTNSTTNDLGSLD